MINFSSIEPDAYYAFASSDINVNNILGSGKTREELRAKYPNAKRIIKGSTVKTYGINDDGKWSTGEKVAAGLGLAALGYGAYKLANAPIDPKYEIDKTDDEDERAVNKYWTTPWIKAKQAVGLVPKPKNKQYDTKEEAERELVNQGMKQIEPGLWNKSGNVYKNVYKNILTNPKSNLANSPDNDIEVI